MTDHDTPQLTQNRNRVDHVAFLLRPENFDSARARAADLLGLNFEGPYDLDQAGLRICIDWAAGIEFITPVDPANARIQAAFLDQHGEGFYRLVFGVTDLAAALERACAGGMQAGLRMDGLSIDSAWRDRFARMDEVTIGEVVPGMFITLGQIEPR